MNARAEPTRPAAARAATIAVLLLALLPSLGTLDAPWIAEDASILAQVREDGPWADWARSQFGMRIVSFWRPLVSTSWALQEAWTGIAPVPLRLLNLALHAGVAVLVLLCARRLACGVLAAGLAGAWIALFPEQGGTSTWIAGRTDLLCAFFLLASLAASLGRRPAFAAPLAFLAAAAKEFGFLAPLWAFAFLWARDGRSALRRALPALAGTGLAFLWRRLALGGFSGGYAGELPALGTGLVRSLAAVSASAWPSLLGLGLLAAAGAVSRAALRPAPLRGSAVSPGASGGVLDARGFLAALGAATLAAALLYQLLADGVLEPANRRLLYVPECALALAAGFACRHAGRLRGALLLGLVLLVPRLALAWNDTHDWARAAHEGEAAVARARQALAGSAPSAAPVFFSDFPRERHGAYCLGFGVAARFRPPFPRAPRPVWPWRLVAFVGEPEHGRRALVEPRADGSLWPLDDERGVPGLELRDAEQRAAARLVLDERAFQAAEDRSPRLALAGGPAGARLEALLFTELGYEPFPLGVLDARGAAGFSLMQLLGCTNGVFSVAELLTLAADLGARAAWLELRALGAQGEPLAAADWLELAWSAELAERALSAR